MKKNKFNLSDWLTNTLNINQKKEYRDKIFQEILAFSDKIKDDIQNKAQENHYIIPILNGLNGDLFEENNDPLAIRMQFRNKNQDIPLNKLDDYYDFDQFGGKICILIHGLMGDEYMWKAMEGDDNNKIGDWLEKNEKSNNLYLRYNTGLHISENGRALSNLLDQFIKLYGNRIKQINLLPVLFALI